MVWTNAALDADDVTRAAADKHLFVMSNVLEYASTLTGFLAQWRTGGAWGAGTDISDADYPTSFLYDRSLQYYTKPSGAPVSP